MPLGADRTLREVRFRRSPQIVLGMCLVTFVWLVYAVRNLDFYYDEWDFLDKQQNWTLRDYFVPHVEHWSTVPMLAYKANLALHGARSYAWFSATVLMVHCAIAFLLFTLVRRRCGDALGIGAAAMMLVLGSGSDDIIWAFQVGYTGSVAFGLLALICIDAEVVSRRRCVGVAGFLTLALASSGVGLYFLVAAAAWVVVRKRWELLRVLVVPAGIYGLWYAFFGSSGVGANRSPFTVDALKGVTSFVPTGIGSGAVGLFNPETVSWDVAAFVVFCSGLGWVVWRRRGDAAPAVAAGAGVFTQFLLTGLVRAQIGDAEARTSRYRYVAAVFVLIVLAEVLRNLRWGWALRVLIPAVVVSSCVYNAEILGDSIKVRTALLGVQKDKLRTAWYVKDSPDIQQDAVIDTLRAPTLRVRDYTALRRRLGSPLGELDRAGFDQLARVDPGAVNGAIQATMRLTVVDEPAPAEDAGAQCVDGGGSKAIDLVGADGMRLTVVDGAGGAGGSFELSYWYAGAAPVGTGTPRVVEVKQGHQAAVTLPDSGRGLTWHVRVVPAVGPGVRICRA